MEDRSTPDEMATNYRGALATASRPSLHGDVRAVCKTLEVSKGWSDGAPPHIKAAILAIDLQLYRHAKCPKCRTKTLDVKPQQRRGAYRVLGVCRVCQHEEAF